MRDARTIQHVVSSRQEKSIYFSSLRNKCFLFWPSLGLVALD